MVHDEGAVGGSVKRAAGLPLAVYGTLRPGGRAYAAFDMARRTHHLGRCSIAGHIVDLGGYPGLLPDKGDGQTVVADLLQILDPALLAELDAYEGPDYIRATVRLAQPDCDALVWQWRHGAAGGAAAVPGNDWSLRASEEIDPADDPADRSKPQTK